MHWFLLISAALILPGCLATMGANAVKGAISAPAPAPVVHVHPPQVHVDFEDITFQQMPFLTDNKGTPFSLQDSGDTDPAEIAAAEPGSAEEEVWIHSPGAPPNPDPTATTDFVREALKPIYTELLDRLEGVNERIDHLEGK